MGSPLVRVVFAVLVLATVAAFFVTQQLKSEFPLVLRFAAEPIAFSPDGDGFKDAAAVGFDLSEPAAVDFSIVDSEGQQVRRLVSGRELAGDARHRFRWNGRDDAGRRLPDGTYRMRVVRRDEGRVINSLKEIVLDTVPAPARLLSTEPGVVAVGPGQRPRVRIRYDGPRNTAPEFRVFRTDDGPPRVVRRFRGDGSRSGVWRGGVGVGRLAVDGDYALTVTVRDRAGNLTVSPSEIPSARRARPGTGVSVRRFTLSGPMGVVTAGSAARMTLGPIDRSFDFVLSRFGSPEPIRRGGRIGGSFRVHVPATARTGLYLVRVRAGRRRAVWPLAVAGLPQSKRAARRPRPLLVLPAIAWQGENPVDDDLDGFADTLSTSSAVRAERHFDGGALPRGFGSSVGPLLRFLEAARLPYDLTTDLSLARGEGPALGNAPGVAFAGGSRWLPAELHARLRRYVTGGGRLAAFGAEAFKRELRLRGPELADPSPARRRTAFGERTSLLRGSTGAPLQVFQDDLGIFDGVDAFVGDFTVFEPSEDLPSGARALVRAGRDATQPAFVAYTLGGGIVLRTGAPQWAGELRESRLAVEVPRATERIWALLSGRG